MQNALLRKGLVFGIILLFVGMNIIPHINAGNDEIKSKVGNLTNTFPYHSILDYYYIKNITKALSDIIFSYNESHGEIARGREFGSPGEHKAARIIFENMTKLGLWTYKEKIGDAKPWRPCNLIASKIDVLDYKLIIHNKTSNRAIVCSPIFALIGPRLRPLKLTQNFSYTNLTIRTGHPDSCDEKAPYVILTGKKDPRINTKSPVSSQTKDTGSMGIVDDIKKMFDRLKEYYAHPYWRGSIAYDFNDDEHDMWGSQSFVPKFAINGSIGRMLNTSIDNYTVDFYLNQRLNLSVDSYNIIGQLNGTDRTKTVIVCCLYDSWWCQGTGDSAIGMAIVMGVAKYYMEHHLIPKYTMKFIGFGGEEYGMCGSRYYQATHRRENIIYVIDLNQLGFTQVYPRLTLEIAANNQSFLDDVWKVIQRTDYKDLTENVTDIVPILMKNGHISDDRSFATARSNASCKTVCFLKNGPWLMHHRDGLNHTAGDVFSYFNSTDVNATGDMVLNVTHYLTYDKPLDRSLPENLCTRPAISLPKPFLFLL